MLVRAYKTKDYKKIRLLEPEDSGFVKIKTIDPLLYKDLYNLYNIENGTDFQYLMF
jgi:hypothetical protein